MQNLTPTPNPNLNKDIKQDIFYERIRQARKAFNLALAATGLSTLIGLAGTTILVIGKVPEGSITTAVGLTSSLHCSRLAKDANDRLDKLIAELDNRE
ncbi:MAG: hypothetical protein AAFU53_07780 [Cyanobacteria bacterium J06632_3]